MPKHIAYFILKKSHKNFKKGVKTCIRKKLGSFFEINKKDGTQIKFRKDKWNKELFEPLYSDTNLKKLENEIVSEYNDLIEFSVDKKIEKFGLNIKVSFSWNTDAYYDVGDISVSLDRKFYKTKLEKEIGCMIAEDVKYSVELSETFMKKEIEEGNKRLAGFLNKCNNLSKEVGFDVFENYFN